jgi:DNA-binding MarR family transcriptional regulator
MRSAHAFEQLQIKRRLVARPDILMAVIDTGSMGRAARRLNISQPAVSKAIAELTRARRAPR